jgi:plasmid maintenance system antidote protein VapI
VTQEQNQTNKKGNQVMTDLAALYKLHTKKTDADIAMVLGVHKQKVLRMRSNPGKENLDDIRALARAIGMTQEDWLKLGGYKA